jgi:hypothetical protein
MTAFARLLSESCQRGDARPTLALVYDRGKSSNRGSQARTRVGLRICDGHFLAVVPHQTASLLAEDLVEPGSFVTAYPILHFFTEYDAPIRRPSGMLVVCSGPAAFEPAPMMKSSVPPNAPVTLLRAVLRGCPVILGDRHKSGTHSPCEVGVEGCGKGQCNNKQSSAGEVRRRSTKIHGRTDRVRRGRLFRRGQGENRSHHCSAEAGSAGGIWRRLRVPLRRSGQLHLGPEPPTRWWELSRTRLNRAV